MKDGCWFDVKRIKLGKRIMPVPEYFMIEKGTERGAAEKPAPKS